MLPEIQVVKLSEIIFDKELYPRKTHSPQRVQQYAACLEEIEARGNYMSVAADLCLLDGRHRHLAYLKEHDGKDCDVHVFLYPVTEEGEKFALAAELNSTHGDQLSGEDKKITAIRLYAKYNYTLDEIARLVAVRKSTVSDWTKAIREEEERQQNERILEYWLACWTVEEIAAEEGINESTVKLRIQGVSSEKFLGTKMTKLANFALETDSDGKELPDETGWKRPLYNVWTYARKSNKVEHAGNSEQAILENLLHLYTEPFDIVLDPFAGGGATIDVCKTRLRRYWASDRKPIVEREKEIRLLDIVQDLPPLHKRWSEVTLTYLDPPYWKQTQGKYSDDPEDLANQSLEDFTRNIVGVVKRITQKQSRGAIAMLISPTQWPAPDHEYTDHIFQIISGVNGNKKLKLEYRVSVPYSTEQYYANQVEWAKQNKKLLVLTRELIIWRFV